MPAPAKSKFSFPGMCNNVSTSWTKIARSSVANLASAHFCCARRTTATGTRPMFSVSWSFTISRNGGTPSLSSTNCTALPRLPDSMARSKA